MRRKKIGIVLPYQNGDLITATSVLRYRDSLWPDCDIVWFCNEPHSDALKFQDIEIRYFPHGWDVLAKDISGQYSERVKKDKEDGKPEWEDWSVLRNSDNKLIQELKHNFKSFEDLDEAYFAAPWMLSPIQRHGYSYPQCSQKVFGVPLGWEWHPYLLFSDEERKKAEDFINNMGNGKRVLIETFAGSGQSTLSEEMICEAMNLCLEHWGENCNFVFASHKFLKKNEDFPQYLFEQPNVFSCANFTVRQCALIADKSDLMISVSSGITVAASAWGIKQPPTIQFTGSWVCSTKTLANGEFKLVTADDKKTPEAKKEFYFKLQELLKKHK